MKTTDIDSLAQEIRRVDGDHSLGAAALAEALMPFLSTLLPADTGSWEAGREALVDIAAERARQVSAEGWTREHDDAHTEGELAKAAACYAVGRRILEGGPTHFDHIRRLWPWDIAWFKVTNRRRDLVKAGALIVAEIERLDRATAIRALQQPDGGQNNGH